MGSMMGYSSGGRGSGGRGGGRGGRDGRGGSSMPRKYDNNRGNSHNNNNRGMSYDNNNNNRGMSSGFDKGEQRFDNKDNNENRFKRSPGRNDGAQDSFQGRPSRGFNGVQENKNWDRKGKLFTREGDEEIQESYQNRPSEDWDQNKKPFNRDGEIFAKKSETSRYEENDDSEDSFRGRHKRDQTDQVDVKEKLKVKTEDLFKDFKLKEGQKPAPKKEAPKNLDEQTNEILNELKKLRETVKNNKL